MEELRNLIIASPDGAPVRVRDVANVVDGPRRPRSARAPSTASAPSALVVRKQSGANTVQVAQ